AHAGAGRNVRETGDFHPALDSNQIQTFSNDGMTNFCDARNVFRTRIFDAYFFVEIGVDRDVHRLVDRAADHGSGFTTIELRQVTAAAGKANAKRGLGEDHASFSSSAASPAGLPIS